MCRPLPTKRAYMRSTQRYEASYAMHTAISTLEEPPDRRYGKLDQPVRSYAVCESFDAPQNGPATLHSEPPLRNPLPRRSASEHYTSAAPKEQPRSFELNPESVARCSAQDLSGTNSMTCCGRSPISKLSQGLYSDPVYAPKYIGEHAV